MSEETDIQIVEAELRRAKAVPTGTAGEWKRQHEEVLALQAELDELRAMNVTKAMWVCAECGRVFDLLDDDDANEWHYGHDCEQEG